MVRAPTIDALERGVAAGLARTRSDLIEAAVLSFLQERDMSGVHPMDRTWDAYYDLLRSQEGRRYFGGRPLGVFDPEKDSYRWEIESVRDALDRAGSFSALEGEDRLLACGLGRSAQYLGGMGGSPLFKRAMREEWPRIASAVDRLPPRGPVAESLERDVLDGLLAVSGVGMAAASRLMTLARPDLYFPVNGGSKKAIEANLGPTWIDSEAKRADAYAALLARVRTFRWFQSPKPDGAAPPEERWAWSARVALLDAVLFDA